MPRRNIGEHTIDKKGKSPTTYESMTLPRVICHLSFSSLVQQQHNFERNPEWYESTVLMRVCV